jgi:hypothetical protein
MPLTFSGVFANDKLFGSLQELPDGIFSNQKSYFGSIVNAFITLIPMVEVHNQS